MIYVRADSASELTGFKIAYEELIHHRMEQLRSYGFNPKRENFPEIEVIYDNN